MKTTIPDLKASIKTRYKEQYILQRSFSMSLPLDLILYIVIAVILVIWLNNALGTRHGDERTRENPFDPARQPPPQHPAEGQQKAAPASGLDIPSTNMRTAPPPVTDTLPRNTTKAGSVEAVLSTIQQIDPSFDLGTIVRQAQEAYAIILEAYADADRETLADLTTPDILAQFDSLITANTQRNIRLTFEVQGVRACHIADLRLTGSVATLDLEFVADALMTERTEKGDITQGHDNKTTELRDKWSFTRDLRQRDPSWRVSMIHDAVGV